MEIIKLNVPEIVGIIKDAQRKADEQYDEWKSCQDGSAELAYMEEIKNGADKLEPLLKNISFTVKDDEGKIVLDHDIGKDFGKDFENELIYIVKDYNDGFMFEEK